MSDKKELNDTQLLFANEYLSNGMNKTAAARVAYPDAKCHAEIGAENYRKPHIKEYIQERVLSLLQGKGELTSKLLDKWCEIAFYEFNGETENPKWKTQDILKATDQLSKYLGLNIEKQEVNHSGGQILTIKREIVKPSDS